VQSWCRASVGADARAARAQSELAGRWEAKAKRQGVEYRKLPAGISKITGTWRAGASPASPASHSQNAASSVASRPAASLATHVRFRAS
jgi:hypothetical protein